MILLRAFRQRYRGQIITFIGLFAMFNIITFLFYSNPKLKTSQFITNQFRDQDLPLFEDSVADSQLLSDHEFSEVVTEEPAHQILAEEEIYNSSEESSNDYQSNDKNESQKTLHSETQEVNFETIQKLFNNPWFAQENDSDPLAFKPFAYEEKILNGCGFKDFTNYSYFGVPSFAPEYIAYKDCKNGQSEIRNRWIRDKISATVGKKGELAIDTSRVDFDIDQPEICQNSVPENLFIVRIQPSQDKKRNLIRETWGASMQTEDAKNRLIFFISQAEKNFDEDLIYESEKFRDIVRTLTGESEDLFSTKQQLSALIWVQMRCPLARFITFTSADTFINVKRFDLLTEKEMFAANRIYGTLMKHMQPNRDEKAKHFISEENWPWKFFPPFLAEPTFIMSSDVVPRLLFAASVLDLVPLEQVYVTGLVPLLARVIRIDVANFFLDEVPQETESILRLVEAGSTLDPSNLCIFFPKGGIHGVHSREQMVSLNKIFEEVNRHNVTCSEGPKCLAKVEGKCLLFAKDTKKKSTEN